MNERIRKLYLQAHSVREYPQDDPMRGGNPPTVYWQGEVSAKKFAGLIVKECIGIVENSPSSYGDYRDQISNSTREACVEKMKQQFEIVEQKGWVCPKCGIDRIQAACPKGHSAALTGECPMVVTAQ